jgi:hypothetical protein
MRWRASLRQPCKARVPTSLSEPSPLRVPRAKSAAMQVSPVP